jgi:hypothetical protein
MANGVKHKKFAKNNMFYEFEEVPYAKWGPWRNQWGYITEIAQFDEDDIMLKSITPYNRKILRRFSDWEDCQRMIELIEQDRRF